MLCSSFVKINPISTYEVWLQWLKGLDEDISDSLAGGIPELHF